MNCKNCETELQGKYCSHCGQNANVDKLTLPSLLNELSESILQVNRGFLFTLKELFTRPGNSIREYLNGKRKKYFKPIGYVLIISTVYFLTTQISNQNTWMDDLITGISEGAGGSEGEIPKILNWFAKNFAYTTLLLLPVFSLASYLAFFRLKKKYIEHIVLNSYVAGQQAIFYTVFAFVMSLADTEYFGMLTLLVVSVGYAFMVFWQFFKQGNRIINVLRSILTYVLYLVFSIGILAVLIGITELSK